MNDMFLWWWKEYQKRWKKSTVLDTCKLYCSNQFFPRSIVNTKQSMNTTCLCPTRKLRENNGNGIVLVNCGSFSPITLAHLLLMESAHNFAVYRGFQVLGGYLSPVHDSYRKTGLIHSRHRLEMCQIAVEDSSWLMVDSWECSRSEYSPTFLVMEHFRRQMDSFYGDRVQLAFVCGSDLYHSLFDPEIWPKEHVERLLDSASLFVVPRTEDLNKCKVDKQVAGYLPGYQDKVFIVNQAPLCQISSTLVSLIY